MFGILIKSALIIGSCSSLAIISTLWSKPEGRETDEKINFKKHKKKTVSEIKRIQDIDVWGKENGCAFIFSENLKNNKVNTALEYAEKSNWRGKDKRKKIEEEMVKVANKLKTYCGEKMKTFTFFWDQYEEKFDIGDPDKLALNRLNKAMIEGYAKQTVGINRR